jgi:predicted metal-binding protein
MIDLRTQMEKARAQGFESTGELQASTLQFLPQVRDMCAANLCRCYGKNWTCPPSCGTIEDSTRKAQGYHQGILVQTVGKLDDDFDYETMESAQQLHNQRFHSLVAELRQDYPGLLAMGAGACTLCAECTCPAAPCRFPDQAIASMEAYGLFVSQVCEANHLAYNHGPLTVTYTSCLLLE